MKEVIGRTKINNNDFPRKLLINNEEILNKNQIANSFNNYFTKIASNLTAKIPNSENNFSTYI